MVSWLSTAVDSSVVLLLVASAPSRAYVSPHLASPRPSTRQPIAIVNSKNEAHCDSISIGTRRRITLNDCEIIKPSSQQYKTPMPAMAEQSQPPPEPSTQANQPEQRDQEQTQEKEAPGVRASRFQQTYDVILKRTLGKVGWDNFAGCYPTIAKRAEPVLRQVHEQMVNTLEEKCNVRFYGSDVAQASKTDSPTEKIQHYSRCATSSAQAKQPRNARRRRLETTQSSPRRRARTNSVR